MRHALSQLPSAEFYSEGIYRIQSTKLSNNLFARFFAPVGLSISPFVQMGADQSWGQPESRDLYFSPGLAWDLKTLKIFGEHRIHQSSSIENETGEWRLLIFSGFKSSQSLARGRNWLFFVEPYTEMLISSSETSLGVWNGWVRLGLEHPFTPDLGFQVFLEPQLSLSEKAKDLFFSSQLRPTARIRGCINRFCLALSAAQFFYFERNKEPDLMFLASFGGSTE